MPRLLGETRAIDECRIMFQEKKVTSYADEDASTAEGTPQGLLEEERRPPLPNEAAAKAFRRIVRQGLLFGGATVSLGLGYSRGLLADLISIPCQPTGPDISQ